MPTDERATAIRRLMAADHSAADHSAADHSAADHSAAGDLAGLLGHVCRIAAGELTASGVGVSVLGDDGGRTLYAASDAASERFGDLPFVLGEGPCIDAFGGRRPVLVPDLSRHATTPWPLYAPAAHTGGLRAVFAFPLQVGAARLGVMDVFRERAGPLTPDQLGTAFLVADIIVETLLERQGERGVRGVADELVWSVGNRAQLFQAQGMVMVQLGVSLGEALVRMRAYAFAEDRRLDDLARDVVNRTLRFDRDAP